MKNSEIKLSPALFLLLLSLYSVPVSSQGQFTKHTIATMVNPMDLYVYDVNQDGHRDIITGTRGNTGEVHLWLNNGNEVFTSTRITGNFGTPRGVRAGDIDNDGDIDIIAAAWSGNKICWWQNDGQMHFTEKVVEDPFIGAHTVELCDVDRDGDVDIIASQFNMAGNSAVGWWENDGNQNWTKHILTTRFQQSPFAFGADMDNDGDIDIVACGEADGDVLWYENNGSQAFMEHMIDDNFPMAHTLAPKDLDKDGDLDILAAACMSSKLAWYENSGTGSFTKHSLSDLPGALWLESFDMDWDGDYDMVGIGQTNGNLICFTNDGLMNFTRSNIAGGISNGFALNLADLDGDRDIDIIAIGYSTNTLAWWENTTPRPTRLNAPKWMGYNTGDGTLFLSNGSEGDLIRSEATGFRYTIRNQFPTSSLMYYQGLLWTTSVSQIRIVDPVTGCIKRILTTPAVSITGITTDGSGNVYFADGHSGSIFRLDPSTGQIISFTTGLIQPGQIHYDPLMDAILILDGESQQRVSVMSTASGDVLKTVQFEVATGGDITGDGKGNYFLSCPVENKIMVIPNRFENPPEEFAEVSGQPTGLVFLEEYETLLVACPGTNSIEEITGFISSTRNNLIQNGEYLVYPNPFTEMVTIQFEQSDLMGPVEFQLLNLNGQMVVTMALNVSDTRESGPVDTITLDCSDVPHGIYLLKITSKDAVFQTKILKMQ